MLARHNRSLNLTCVYILQFVGSWSSRSVGPTVPERDLILQIEIEVAEFLRMSAQLEKNLLHCTRISELGPIFFFMNRL